jgi:hypothetical protein
MPTVIILSFMTQIILNYVQFTNENNLFKIDKHYLHLSIH